MKKLLYLLLTLLLFSSCSSLVDWLNRPDDVHEAIEKQNNTYMTYEKTH